MPFSFNSICAKTPFPLCSLVASGVANSDFQRGIVPLCYARPVEIANTMIFQLGNAIVHIGALFILLIIIFNIRVKYTAIGRSEMLYSMYLYVALIVSLLIVDCGVCPPSSGGYAYFTALQIALASCFCMSLLYNSILYFQLWEDSTFTSMSVDYVLTIGWFITNYAISVITFKGWNTALDNSRQMPLLIVSFIMNAALLLGCFVALVILVFFALESWWALGAMVLAGLFFVAGQVIVYIFSGRVCTGTSHYADGLLFGSMGNLFAVMMVYKFWDVITAEDLEFLVAKVARGYSNEDEKRKSALL